MNFRIRLADKKYSEYLREKRNHICEYCGRRFKKGEKGLTVSHFYGRKSESTRFDDENCDVLCWLPCHNNFEQDPHEYSRWKQTRMTPQAFKLLQVRAHTYQKKDDAKILIFLNAVMKTKVKEKKNPDCIHGGKPGISCFRKPCYTKSSKKSAKRNSAIQV